MEQAFPLRDLAGAANHAVVDQLVPAERLRQRHQQWLVVLGGHLARRIERSIGPEPNRPWIRQFTL